MPYIGHSPEVAQRRYESVDDISGSFDGSTTSFALQVGGVAPAPFPVASENVLISVGGVIQEPDGTGTNGFQLTGTNIVFSSAPAAGQSFFGVILAGADYVTAGHAFPDGDAAAPSLTFSQDLDTGMFRAGSGAIGFGGDGSERARLDGSGRLLVGTTTARAAGDVTAPLQVEGTGFNTSSLNLISNAGASSGNVSYISLAKSRGTSDGSSTVVADDDNLGTIQFCGADGTDLNSVAASITAAVDGTPGSNDMPGRLLFSTSADGASSPSERARINATGYFGIGGIDPKRHLHINGGNETTKIQITNQTTGSSTDGEGFHLGIATDGTANIEQRENADLVFSTNGSEAFRVDSARRIGIADGLSGTQDLSNSRLSAYGNSSTATGSIPIAVHTANVASERYMIVFFNGNGNVGNIRTNGSATSYNTSSDYRLKENVVGITDGIARVKQLQPKRFNFIADADTTLDGFLAHEAQAVVPEAISGTHNQVQVWDESEELPDGVSVGDNKLDEDGNTIPEYQSIDQSKLVPLLTAALQEAISKIETLETQNTAQQTTIDDLLARVTALEAA